MTDNLHDAGDWTSRSARWRHAPG